MKLPSRIDNNPRAWTLDRSSRCRRSEKLSITLTKTERTK